MNRGSTPTTTARPAPSPPTPPDGEAKSGGASIDQVIRQPTIPDGLPPGMVPTLVGGTFFRRSRVSRYVHSYNADGTVAATMQETPRDLSSGSSARRRSSRRIRFARQQRLKRSVLDSVVDQYRFYTGANSPLGAASKARVADHLDRIREFEQRAFELTRQDRRSAPTVPPRSQTLPRRPGRPRRSGNRHHARRADHRMAADGRPLRAGDPDGPRAFRLAHVPRRRRTASASPATTNTMARRRFEVRRRQAAERHWRQGLQPRMVAQVQREEEERAASRPRPYEDARGRLLP